MRERLIELIKQGDKTFADKYEGKVMSHIDEVYEFVADYLLANGVIVPPCKVGDTVYNLMECSCENIDGVYTVCEFYDEGMCACKTICTHLYRIEKCLVTDGNLLIFTKKWGKTVFLTKEEAEQALRKEDEGK